MNKIRFDHTQKTVPLATGINPARSDELEKLIATAMLNYDEQFKNSIESAEYLYNNWNPQDEAELLELGVAIGFMFAARQLGSQIATAIEDVHNTFHKAGGRKES